MFGRAQDAPNARVVVPTVDSPLSLGADDDGSVKFVTQPASTAVSPRPKRRLPQDMWTMYPHWFPEFQVGAAATASAAAGAGGVGDRVSPFEVSAGAFTAVDTGGSGTWDADEDTAVVPSGHSQHVRQPPPQLMSQSPMVPTTSPLQTAPTPLFVQVDGGSGSGSGGAAAAASSSAGVAGRRPLEPVPPSDAAPTFGRSMQSTSPRMMLARRVTAVNAALVSSAAPGSSTVTLSSVGAPALTVSGTGLGDARDESTGGGAASPAISSALPLSVPAVVVPSPTSAALALSRRDEYQQRVAVVRTVVPTTFAADLSAPPPSGSHVTPHGVVSLRRFVLPYTALPSLRHVLPPPIPEPISMIAPGDVATVMYTTMIDALQDLARYYLERRRTLVGASSVGMSVSLAPRGPLPCPWTGQTVYDLYGDRLPEGSLATAPLPVPLPVPSYVMHEFFQDSLRQLAGPSTSPSASSMSAMMAGSSTGAASAGSGPTAWDSSVPPLEFESRFESGGWGDPEVARSSLV